MSSILKYLVWSNIGEISLGQTEGGVKIFSNSQRIFFWKNCMTMIEMIGQWGNMYNFVFKEERLFVIKSCFPQKDDLQN